jgi:hypothetical protein
MWTWLVRKWRRRLVRLRNDGATAVSGRPWLLAIRIRILTFLIVRYGDRAVQEIRAEPPRPRSAPPSWPLAFDPAVRADGPEPRLGASMRRLLREVRRCNLASRPRWRFWP